MAVGRTTGDDRPVLLVLRALGLGDFLTGLPALRALADAFPGHRRVLATPALLEPLVRLTGTVDAVLPVDDLPPLPTRPPDVAVNLHGRGPLSHRRLLALRPRRLIAFVCPEVAHPGPEWWPDEHEVARWCRLLRESGTPADPARLDLDLDDARHHGATVIHPGAASRARQWPVERWAAVARHERSHGHEVLVTGSAAEAELAQAVARLGGLSPDVAVAGRTDVVQLARLVSGAGLVLCGDTGVGHLATATRTPSVLLFGPTPPALWGPPADRPLHRVLWAGRTGDPHGRRPDPGLLALDVDEVLAAVAHVRGSLSKRSTPVSGVERSNRERAAI